MVRIHHVGIQSSTSDLRWRLRMSFTIALWCTNHFRPKFAIYTYPPYLDGRSCSKKERKKKAKIMLRGMNTDGNGWKNRERERERERERNNRERKRKRDMLITETCGNRKIYRKALIFNLHSPYMNITLHTHLCKQFFHKNMIKTSCFLCLSVKCTD